MTGCRYSLPFIPNTGMNQGRMWSLLALPFMPAAQTGRELSVFCSRCKTRKFPLTCILDLFDHVFRHGKIGFSITYYTCCIEKQLKPSWYLGWYSKKHQKTIAHCSKYSRVWEPSPEFQKKTLPMKRWRAATRQDYTQCCDWCLRGRQSLAGGNPTARWSRYSSLLAVTWPKHTETTFDLCPKWLDNHTKVSRLTLFISLNKNHHFFLEAPHNNHFKIAYSAIRWCLRLDSIPPSAPAEQNGL